MTISNELLEKQKGNSSFDKIGKASLAFAREYPVLFREFTMQPNAYMAYYETLEKMLLETLAEDEAMRDWTLNERKELLFKMRVFQIGLSVMIANGQIPPWLDEKGTEDLLMETGKDLLTAINIKRNG